MSWYYVVLLCVVSFWLGIFVAALLSVSKCNDCKAKEFNGLTLKCKKCGSNNLHIANHFKYDIKNSSKGLGNNED